MAAYSDLNLIHTKAQNVMERNIEMAIRLGYEVIAINNVVDDISGGKAKKKQNLISVIDPPHEIKVPEHVLANLQVKGRKLQQYSRFSTVLTDVAQTHKLNSREVQAYDLIAVTPTSEKLLQLACGTLEVDIISLPLSEKISFHLKRNSIKQAIERGIHFEIHYTPMITDATQRKNIICNALNLMNICKGKGVILSSQCEKPFDLRGPFDVANLGLLFGLTEQQSRAAVSTNCRAVLMHARCRKSSAGALEVMKASSLAPGEMWKIEHSTADTENTNVTETDSDTELAPSISKKQKVSN